MLPQLPNLPRVDAGVLADRLGASDRRWQYWIPAAGSALAAPLWVGTLGASSLESSLALLFAEYLVAECWFGPTVTQLQLTAPAGTAGLTTGVFSFLTLVGNLAPFLIGLGVQSGDYELGQLLGPSVAALYTLAALAFVAAGQAAAPPQRDEGARDDGARDDGARDVARRGERDATQ